MEQKEPEAASKAASLISIFKSSFSHIQATIHPSGVPGEIAGKSSNVAYAAQHVINTFGTDGERNLTSTLITVIDGMLNQIFSICTT